MQEEEKSNTIKILKILFVVSTLIIGVYYLISLGGNIKLSNNLIPNINFGKKDVGYNFELPDTVSAEEVSSEEPTTTPTTTLEPTVVVSGQKDTLLTQEQKDYAFNYHVEEGQLGTIAIPAIGVNSAVYRGSDGDRLLDSGFWHYPSTNMPGQGETILLCHRRYFGENDPRSCWKIDALRPGDFIQLNDNNGKPLRYVVKSVNVKAQEDLNIYQLSKENYLKLVSCSLPDGRPGGSSHRVVVVAEKV